MTVPYPALAIANNFVERFNENEGIEHMKLQKLVYRSYGWWLAVKGLDSPRLTVRGPEVWRYGPVFADLYPVLKLFGRNPITKPKSMNPFEEPPNVDAQDSEVQDFIVWIWERYGHLSSFALSDMTHREGTPWERMAKENNYSVPRHTMIRDRYIHEEFIELMGVRSTPQKGYNDMSRTENKVDLLRNPIPAHEAGGLLRRMKKMMKGQKA